MASVTPHEYMRRLVWPGVSAIAGQLGMDVQGERDALCDVFIADADNAGKTYAVRAMRKRLADRMEPGV